MSRPKNCVNCGAPLHGDRCPYCGTEYNGGGVVAEFGESDFTGTLTVGGKEYKVYLGNMEIEHFNEIKRDIFGRIIYAPENVKHVFTLIEI